MIAVPPGPSQGRGGVRNSVHSGTSSDGTCQPNRSLRRHPTAWSFATNRWCC